MIELAMVTHKNIRNQQYSSTQQQYAVKYTAAGFVAQKYFPI